MADELADIGSPVLAFLNECCALAPGALTTIEELYERWQDWTKEQGWKDPGTQQSFGRQLLAADPSVQPVRRGPRGERWRGYQGVRLLGFGESG
jgi:putative DNA primase/helicase